MAEPHPLILSLRCAGLKDVDTCNLDEVHNMWAAFSRAKNCIDGGDRLEYLSWRIYSREILARKPVATGGASATLVKHDADDATSPSDPEPETNDSDYESYSDDSGTEIFDSPRMETTSKQVEGREDKGPPKDAHAAPPPVPQLVATKHKSFTTHPHRRISSIELQHLFKEARSLDPNGLKKCALTARQQGSGVSVKHEPIQVPQVDSSNTRALGSVPPTESSIALNAYQNRFGTPTVREPAREMSKEPTAIRDSSSSLFNRVPETGSSTVVRGFSPSSVSVSVFMNRGLARKPEVDNPVDEHNKGDGKAVTWKKASLPREKIFFIEAESDSDASSIAGSPDHNSRTKSGKHGKHLEISEPDKSDVNDAGLGQREDEDEGDASYGSSGWDDTEGEEDNSDEERRSENMFKERAVPSKPLLKRSLLSSLFVNDMNRDTTPPTKGPPQGLEDNNSGSPVDLRASSSPPDQSHVAAPVHILLGAAVAPHIPLPVASPRTVRRDMFDTELSQSLRDNMKQSRHYDVDRLFQERPVNSRSFSDSAAELSVSETSEATPTISSLHMTARPEMYRASTDNGVSYRRPSEERASWQSHHEDIYDPMNYHSRGW